MMSTERQGICVKAAKVWKPLVLCTVVFLLLIAAYFAGRNFSGTVIYDAPPEAAAQEQIQTDSKPASSAAIHAVNINTANSTELETLPGIGPVLAERIVAYRQEHGAFRTIDQIKDVDGIGEATFAEIKSQITVGD